MWRVERLTAAESTTAVYTMITLRKHMLLWVLLILIVHAAYCSPTRNEDETDITETTVVSDETLRDNNNVTLPWWRRRPYPLRQSFPQACKCQDYLCGCCAGLEMQRLNISQKGCLNFRYDPDQFSLEVEMLMNDRALFSRSISARNPPPVCIPLPNPVSFIPSIDFCARLFDVFTPGRNMHMCLDWTTRVNQSPVFIMEFDCLRFGADGFAMLKPDAGGGLPAGGGGGGSTGDLEIEAPSGGVGGGGGGGSDYDELDPEKGNKRPGSNKKNSTVI